MPPARGVPRHAEADDPAVLGQRQGPAPYVPGNRRELAPAGRDECEPARRHALQAAQHKQVRPPASGSAVSGAWGCCTRAFFLACCRLRDALVMGKHPRPLTPDP
eukprot:2225437-Rhodomonas_salina.6